MRNTLLASALLLSPELAAAQQCVPAAQPAAAQAASQTAAAVPVSPGDRNVYPIISAEEIARSPALRRIASRGATLLDLGTVDGLRLVFAHLNDAMEAFHVTPSGRYAVRSGRLNDYEEPDPAKRDITILRAAKIPGVVPTVDMRAAAPGHAEALAALETTHVGLIGEPGAPKVFMFIDPFCKPSMLALTELRPHIAAGKLQVALVPIAVLDRAADGPSTRAALALLSSPPERMEATWAAIARDPAAFPHAEHEAAIHEKLRHNLAVAARLGVPATPTISGRGPDGTGWNRVGAGGAAEILAAVARR